MARVCAPVDSVFVNKFFTLMIQDCKDTDCYFEGKCQSALICKQIYRNKYTGEEKDILPENWNIKNMRMIKRDQNNTPS